MGELDRDAVLALVDAYVEAIREGDEGRFRELWCGRDDDTVVSITRDHRGIDAICRDFYTGGLHRIYDSVELVADGEPSVRPLADGACVAVFRHHTERARAGTGGPHGIAGAETQVMRRTGRGWRLAHAHYSKGAPGATRR